MRIGDVAREVGTTPRTIRYYEEIGLLPRGEDREAGKHRFYTPEDVERLTELLRVKELLGVSLRELRELLDAEDTRAALRSEWRAGTASPARRREILGSALAIAERQLELVAPRAEELARFRSEVDKRRRRIRARLAELEERAVRPSAE